MQIHIKETDLNSLQTLRTTHLESLPEPRELFLEMKVRSSRGYRIEEGNKTIGYVCITAEYELSEFWISPSFLPKAEMIFGQLVQRLGVKAVWCHSFDRLTLSLCLEGCWEPEIAGYLFRSRIPSEFVPLPKGIGVRRATPKDLERILEKDDSYFESREEAESILRKELLFYFHREEEFIACGTIMHIFADTGVYDIGMLVNPACRRQGIGTAIIHYLADYCQQQGWQAICGCAADNIASRRTLEKAGFVTRDRMILFREPSRA